MLPSTEVGCVFGKPSLANNVGRDWKPSLCVAVLRRRYENMLKTHQAREPGENIIPRTLVPMAGAMKSRLKKRVFLF